MSTFEITICGQTNVGSVRMNNEDAFVVVDLAKDTLFPEGKEVALLAGEDPILLAVSDGMGGEKAGEVASAVTLATLRRELREAIKTQSKEDALASSVQAANESVLEAARAPQARGMGATLTAVVISGTQAVIAEVGDSRAYVIRGDRIVQLTHDQSYVQFLVDSGALTREEAETFPQKNVILQAIGKVHTISVGLARLELRRGDQLLVCSDGLTGMLPNEEIREIVTNAPRLDVACARLIAAANQRGGVDNITVVLARVSGEGLQEPKASERLTESAVLVKPFRP